MGTSQRILTQTVIALVAIGINLLAPEFAENTRYFLLALVILLIGMPHGALDHHIDGNLEGWNPYTINKRFYAQYFILMGIYSFFWIFFPFFSFMFFLLITLYHFGQADAMRFSFSGWEKWAIHIGRGITVVGLIVYGDLAYSSSIIEAVTNISIAEASQGVYDPEIVKWSIAGFYPLVYLLILVVSKQQVEHKIIYFVDALIVPALFIYCDLVWAFSIYFGIWHSYNHALVMLRYLTSKEHSVNFGWFFKESFLFSLLSYLGLLFVYNMLNAFGNEELLVSLLFVVIAVLTLPHMIVVEKLYKRWDRN
jgi:Brp/Blh family beta-carotene 15,15'-monooxygenase